MACQSSKSQQSVFIDEISCQTVPELTVILYSSPALFRVAQYFNTIPNPLKVCVVVHMSGKQLLLCDYQFQILIQIYFYSSEQQKREQVKAKLIMQMCGENMYLQTSDQVISSLTFSIILQNWHILIQLKYKHFTDNHQKMKAFERGRQLELEIFHDCCTNLATIELFSFCK
ncbi:Hypothetical_protein [Hexamita inflata]|uniref:Hypothetical_protein n=1 Tax=Hexamita inflata TaxID=28002 RepID=A0AA86TI51_9EUKA|nr:Hypothetical protein HINF_LOCUS5566 [Hexamita inflata]